MTINDHFAYVHIWHTKEGRCGHAAVELESPDGKKNYTGMWPHRNFSPLVNLFTMSIPVPAESSKNLNECCEREGDEAPLHPESTYKIKISSEEYHKMRSLQDSIHDEIENRTTVYNLAPPLSLVTLMKQLTSETVAPLFNTCPISGIQMDHERAESDRRLIHTRKLTVLNCASSAHRIINAGVRISDTWTPMGLAQAIENLGPSRVKKI